jgi:hypothetical protein
VLERRPHQHVESDSMLGDMSKNGEMSVATTE